MVPWSLYYFVLCVALFLSFAESSSSSGEGSKQQPKETQQRKSRRRARFVDTRQTEKDPLFHVCVFILLFILVCALFRVRLFVCAFFFLFVVVC